jgi:Xaa-Pro aminopeptidase
MDPIGFSKDKANKVLDKLNIDVLIASTPVNVFYTTGLPTLHVAPNPILYVLYNQFPSMSLVRRDGEESLIYWMLYQSTNKFTWVKDVNAIASPKMGVDSLCKKIEEWGLGNKTIGLESLMPRYQSEAIRQRFPNANIVDGDEAFLQMRLTKTEEEINRIKKSTQITDKALTNMMNAVHEGITDNDLLQIARRSIVDEGAEGWDHLTLSIGTSDPEAPGIGTVMHKGDIGRFDVGTVWKGYISDISRHSVMGQPPEGAIDIVDSLIKVQDYCVENIKPGVNTKEFYETAKKYYKSLGKKGNCYITIHSIGLECEEVHLGSPMRIYDTTYEKNMVMDIEVWQMFKPCGLIGVEDCYVVGNSGCNRISTLDKHIKII